MKTTNAIIAGVILLAGIFTVPAHAIMISVDQDGSALAGMYYLDFDAGAPSCVTLTPDADVVQGTKLNYYAAPYLSGNNNLYFGDIYTGPDTTKYLTSGRYPSPGGFVTFSFDSDQDYFGLLWGSVDTYNTLSFYRNGQEVGSVTGSDLQGVTPNGYQFNGGSAYVNITGITFDKVTAVSDPSYAFELDNVAYGKVPDGGTTLALLGFGLLGLGALRRKLTR